MNEEMRAEEVGVQIMYVKSWQMYLFNEVDAWLEVEPKVDELPFDALLAVLLLLQHKHVVVEELLQLLVGEVDAQLLERVDLEGGQRNKLNHTDNQDGLLSVHAHYLEDLKTSNVEHSDEEVLASL